MKQEYNHTMNEIHAPSDLIASTKQALKQEELRVAEEKQIAKKKRLSVYGWRNVAIAASICLVLLGSGVGYYKINNHIVVDASIFVESNSMSMEAGINLGKINMEGETERLKTEQFDERTQRLNKIWEAAPSKIKGITVYITQGEDNESYYAAYKKREQFYLVSGKSVSLEEFLKYLKENL